MARERRRRQIAWEAARLLAHGEEAESLRARWKVAIRVCGGSPAAHELPGQREIHEEFAKREQSLADDAHGLPAGQEQRSSPLGDRFRVLETLLAPLEQVHENRVTHPEGDALYHSLQVFELAREARPYDEEFLLAALLHDVGKAIDPKEHVLAGLAALEGLITPRTAWFIEHHVEALALQEGRLGARSLRRLEASEDFDDLVLLADCDRKGRRRGVPVADVRDALQYIRELAESNGE